MLQLPEPFQEIGFIGLSFLAMVAAAFIRKSVLALSCFFDACLKISKSLLTEFFYVKTRFRENLTHGFAFVKLVIRQLLELRCEIHYPLTGKLHINVFP